MAGLVLKNLGKCFGPVAALAEVNLDIGDGEFLALLGPSGCGKTTLLRLIAGFLEPDSGSISINSRDVSDVPAYKRNLAMVFQNYALWPHMSVGQNVMFGLEMHGVTKSSRKELAYEALAMVQMERYWERAPDQLSGGQQQRVALARALALSPDALLLDEPLSNLDLKLRSELRREIKQLHAQTKLTMLYVTHEQREALAMADRIAILNEGRLAQVGPPEALQSKPASPFVAEFLSNLAF